jgi:hypothetical protein
MLTPESIKEGRLKEQAFICERVAPAWLRFLRTFEFRALHSARQRCGVPSRLMFEMANAGEDHGNVVLVGSGDHLFVAN